MVFYHDLPCDFEDDGLKHDQCSVYHFESHLGRDCGYGYGCGYDCGYGCDFD